MKLSVLLFSLFCWVAVPGISYAGDGHKHAKGEQHTESEKSDDHSGHDHGQVHGKSKKKAKKKKAKKKHGEKGHDHSQEEDHSEEDGHNHDNSSSIDEGEAHGEDHGHAHAEGESHDEEEHVHSEGEEHAEEEQHAHSEEGGHDDHGDEGGHDEHGASGIGPGKAIIEVANEGNRFKLSNESEDFLNIETTNIEPLGGGQYRIPKSIIVTYQDSKGIYIKSNGWFEIRNIKVLSTVNGHSIVSGNGIEANTLAASTGLGFLRAAHLQATGQGGKGHAH
jgi:hypothetical protein|tara:strand:+ start:33561 stop:34394 length:834 start_codon:yes stop_codon:yes gene_type:complete